MISMLILLVEDERLVRDLFKMIIGPIASRVEEVETLHEAIEATEKERFDVIILDLRLLDSAHGETLDSIPQLRRSGSPVIVVTGIPDPEIEKQAMEHGADFAIQKTKAFDGAGERKGEALLMAVHAAVLKKPRKNPDDDYLHHVAILEKLVHAV